MPETETLCFKGEEWTPDSGYTSRRHWPEYVEHRRYKAYYAGEVFAYHHRQSGCTHIGEHD